MEPPIVDPPGKVHCMLDHSIKDIAQGTKSYSPNTLRTSAGEEDNLSTKDKTAGFILSPKCPLFGGSTVLYSTSLDILLHIPHLLVSIEVHEIHGKMHPNWVCNYFVSP